MSISPFHENWRDRMGDETPPLTRVVEVVDRKDRAKIRCCLLIGREETRTEYSATITLRYVSVGERLGGFHNHPFSGKWERGVDGQDVVSITGGSVMLANPSAVPRGAHIGTYLLDEVVRWAKQWPNAQVKRISLSDIDAEDANRERRNRFYEQFGIEFDYADERRRSGCSRPMVAGALTPVAPEVWGQDIVEWGVVDFLRKSARELESSAMEIARLDRVRSSLQGEVDRAWNTPVSWACGRLFERFQAAGFVLVLVSLVVLSVWRWW